MASVPIVPLVRSRCKTASLSVTVLAHMMLHVIHDTLHSDMKLADLAILAKTYARRRWLIRFN